MLLKSLWEELAPKWPIGYIVLRFFIAHIADIGMNLCVFRPLEWIGLALDPKYPEHSILDLKGGSVKDNTTKHT